MRNGKIPQKGRKKNGELNIKLRGRNRIVFNVLGEKEVKAQEKVENFDAKIEQLLKQNNNILIFCRMLECYK